MANVIIRSEIPSESGLGEDKFTNTFSFMDVPDLGNATLDALLAAVRDFYITIPTGGLAELSDYYSSEVDNTAGQWRLKAYDVTGKLSGAVPVGAPQREMTAAFTTSSGAAVGLPAEVAVCVTLETATRSEEAVETADSGDAGTERDRPMQRHTGRIYLGPLNDLTLSTVGGQIRPASNILDTARLAIIDLRQTAFLNAGGADLAVWSRKDATMRPVEYVSVDNSFDTIRSRGPAATLRERDSI